MEKIYHSHREKFLRRRVQELRKSKLDEAYVLSHIMNENDSHCEPPLTQDELMEVIERAGIVQELVKNEIKYTDRYNAIYFKKQFDGEIFYCAKLGGWHIWDGKRWALDETDKALSLVGKMLDLMKADAEASGNDGFMKHVKSSSSCGKMKATLELARAENMSRRMDEIDKDDLLLNCQNGTLDLGTGVLHDFAKDDYISKITDTPYTPGAPKDKWLKFLNEIFLNDEELINYVQKVIGYAITGLSKEQAMWFLYGNGMNGKGKFLTAIEKTLGEYVNVMPPTELIVRYNDTASNETARLRAARFIIASESGQGKALNEEKIKRLTGEEKLSARHLYQESFEFYFKGKIFLMTNYKPEIRGYDKGIWRRIRLIPFDLNLSEETADKDILEKLLTQKEGILDWCVEGYKKYVLEGLKNPKKVEDALLEYREESDKLGQFLDDVCKIDKELEISASELLQAANEWAKPMAFKVRRNDLNDFMNKKGFEKKKTNHGWCWQGIGLIDFSQKNNSTDFYDTISHERPF